MSNIDMLHQFAKVLATSMNQLDPNPPAYTNRDKAVCLAEIMKELSMATCKELGLPYNTLTVVIDSSLLFEEDE